MIQIPNLTPKQIALCEIMWALEGKQEVEAFVRTLPKADQLLCATLIELMKLAFTDAVDTCDEAKELLDNIFKV
jgi:hypothetical protein